jgi:hypothetical protein
MDFAAALANLEKTAQAAAANTGNNSNRNSSNQRRDDDRRRGRPDDQRNDQRRNQRPRYNDDRDRGRDGNLDTRPLEALSRFGYRVAPYRPSKLEAPLSDTVPATPKHIALLVICIDELPYEHIWKAWATTTTGDALVSILVHAKYPGRVQSSWLRQRLLVHPPRTGRGNCYADPEYLTHAPEWGKVQIARAMVDLVAAGLKIRPNDREADERFSTKRFLVKAQDGNKKADPQQQESKEIPPVDKFIFVSETCLPIKTLEECQEALFEDVKATAETDGNEDVKAASETNGNEDVKAAAETTGNADVKAAVETNGNEDVKSAAETNGNEDVKAVVKKMARPNEVSWINARNRNTPGTPQNKYERDQFQDIHRMVPQQCRWKADQWTVLSRAHAAAVLNIDQHMRQPADQLWNSFARINASDEMYFPTALAILGILKEEDDKTVAPQIAKRAVTYTDWTEGMRNPATYTNGIRDFQRVAKIARQQGCLFARKFALFLAIPGKEKVVTGAIDVDAWKGAIEALQKAEES